MSNSLAALVEKLPLGPDILPRAKRLVLGITHDFWKDGEANVFADLKQLALKPRQLELTDNSAPNTPGTPHAGMATPTSAPKGKSLPEWHAAPGEISEKMWGNGFLTPGDEAVSEMLIAPLGLNKDMSVLDLSAGLGGRLRQTVEKFGVYITGLEPDQQIAQRGMEMSVRAGKGKHAVITAYDPNNFAVAKTYDAIIARETFYRVTDKDKFFKALASCTKPKAQITFTDYIVNPEDRNKPAILAWTKFEQGSAPLGLVEMAEAWAKVGFNLRVHDDQTDFYSKEVIKGLKHFAVFMASGVKPDAETKKSLMRRMQTWTHRMAAIQQGMKFYRFYGTRQ